MDSKKYFAELCNIATYKLNISMKEARNKIESFFKHYIDAEYDEQNVDYDDLVSFHIEYVFEVVLTCDIDLEQAMRRVNRTYSEIIEDDYFAIDYITTACDELGVYGASLDLNKYKL